jgi:mannan endo-1,4-beta-mannosidase
MRKRYSFATLALTLLSFAAVAAAPVANKEPAHAAQSGFVKVKGKHFEIDGQPYYFAGANLWYGMYLGSPGAGGDRARLITELDQLAAQGIMNLRVLAVSEKSMLKRAVTPAVLQGLDSVDDTLWQGLDFLLDEMAKRDMKAVLYVNNFWQWSGGMTSYVSWSTGKQAADPDVSGDWDTYIETSASFYRDAKANEAFRAAVKQLVTRRNSISARAYNQDPTIMSWQLANEPRPGVDGNSKHFDAFTKWIDGTAGFIKTLAPKQLVSTGNEGWMGTAGSRELFVKAHSTKNVDYLTFHMWAPNWTWFKPKEAAATYDSAWTKMQDYLNWHIDTANQLGKPIVLEEFGINRD